MCAHLQPLQSRFEIEPLLKWLQMFPCYFIGNQASTLFSTYFLSCAEKWENILQLQDRNQKQGSRKVHQKTGLVIKQNVLPQAHTFQSLFLTA